MIELSCKNNNIIIRIVEGRIIMKIDSLSDGLLKATIIILYIWSTYSYRTLLKKIESSTTNKEDNNDNDKLLLKYLYQKEIRSFIMFLFLGTTLVYIYSKVKAIL